MLYESGKLEMARIRFKKAHRLMPESVEILVRWSDALRSEARKIKGKDEKAWRRLCAQAQDRLERAMEIDPLNTWPILAFGYLLRERGEFIKALEQFNRATKLDPCDWRSFMGRGETLLFDIKDYVAAAISLSNALSFQPANYRLLCLHGESLQKCGRHGEAIISLQKAVDREPLSERAAKLLDRSLSEHSLIP
jgi:tetratricopeptide (TPR) repeat protein